MKILKVIHGYPMRYNAGSEVYSQTLCHKLADKHEVQVFTREENSFAQDYSMQYEYDAIDKRIKLNIINIPGEKHRDQYQISEVDQQFLKLLLEFKPDIVHIGHLNHLSTSLVTKIPDNIPILYTLHDYWLICLHGRFIQKISTNIDNVWELCTAPGDLKCAKHCCGGYFSGAEEDFAYESSYWANWVKRRKEHIKTILPKISYFIAPSQYVLKKFSNDLNLPNNKLIHLDYGFDLEQLAGRKRIPNEPFTFGYIGTHIPAKGIQYLIRAFGKLKGNSLLRIWGRDQGKNTKILKTIANSLPPDITRRIEWLPEYRNQKITEDVFNKVDAIVVPSIWYEGSPLVIHEALQARLPVITTDLGGMAEHIKHKVNGLLFKFRNIDSLAENMQYLVDNPELSLKLGANGYLYSDNGNVLSIEEHVKNIEKFYLQALKDKTV